MTENTENATEGAEVLPIKRTRKAPAKAKAVAAPKEKTKNRLGLVVTDRMIENFSELANRAEKRNDGHAADHWRGLLDKVK